MKKYCTVLLLFISLITTQVFAEQLPLNTQPEKSQPENAGNTKFKSVQQKNIQAQEKKDLETIKNGVQVADIYVACKYYFSKLFNTRENVSRKNICNGYFFGSASMLLLLQNEKVDTRTCMPMDISTEEVIKGFLDWADKNPSKNKMLASEALLEILRDNYPCNEYKPLPKAIDAIENPQ